MQFIALRQPKTDRNLVISANNPNSTLAPWLNDDAFMKVFDKTKHNTLVDIYRMYELWTLVE